MKSCKLQTNFDPRLNMFYWGYNENSYSISLLAEARTRQQQALGYLTRKNKHEDAYDAFTAVFIFFFKVLHSRTIMKMQKNAKCK